MKIGAVALCAGNSERIGKENKLLLDFNGKELFKHTVDLIRECNFDKMVIVTAYDEVIKYCESDFIVCENYEGFKGQSLSVKIGTKECENMDAIMYFMCDQPLLNKETVFKIKEEFIIKNKIIVPIYKEKTYSPCIYPKRFFEKMYKLKGDKGGKVVAKNYQSEVEFLNFETDSVFLDIDYMEDLKKIKEICNK